MAASDALQKPMNGPKLNAITTRSFDSRSDEYSTGCQDSIHQCQSVGVSNFTARAMRKSHDILTRRGYCLAAHQYRYSMLHRNIERNGILEAAKELGITIIAWSPLEQGLLTGRFHDDGNMPSSISWARRQMLRGNRVEKTRPLIDRMREIGQNYGASVAQIALNYLIHAQGDTIVAIPGASKVAQVEQHVGALQFALTREEIDELSALC